MKIKTILKTSFLLSYLFFGLLISCSKQHPDFEMEDISELNERDELLIAAIANSSSKQSVSLSDLPTNAKSILETAYETMMAKQSFEVANLGYEVNMVGLEPANLGENENTYFNSEGRELIPGFDRVDPRNSGENEGRRKGRKRRIHFDLVYPVSFTMPDGITITAESRQDFRAQTKAWYEANPEAEEKPALIFPVDVVLEEETITINSAEEMDALKERLREEAESRDSAYEYVFPIRFTMPDNSILTANSEDELKELIGTWYDANPEIKERPQLIYPVDLRLQDGTRITINSEEEMKEFKDSIRGSHEGHHGGHHGHQKPFEFVFPVSFTMPDASTITANNEEALEELIKAWYEANPETEEKPQVVFPVEIIIEDGEILTVNSEEALDEILDELRESHHGGHHGHRKPFEFVFPVSFTMPDASTITANSEEELEELIKAWYEDNPETEEKPQLIFPVNIIIEEGEIITVNSEEALDEILDNLRDHDNDD